MKWATRFGDQKTFYGTRLRKKESRLQRSLGGGGLGPRFVFHEWGLCGAGMERRPPPGAAPAVCHHPASEFILLGICDAGLRDPILQMRESRPGESGRVPAAGPGLTQTCGPSAVLLPVKIPPEVRQRGDSFARHGVRCGAPKTSGFWILGPPPPTLRPRGGGDEACRGISLSPHLALLPQQARPNLRKAQVAVRDSAAGPAPAAGDQPS